MPGAKLNLLIAGARVKTARSHLSSTDLAALAADGGRAAGPSPLPPAEPGTALEVDRTVSSGGIISLGSTQLLAAEVLGGRRVTIRIDPQLLSFFDPETRELLRTRPNPLTWDQAYAAPDPPGRHRAPRSSRSPSNAAPATPA